MKMQNQRLPKNVQRVGQAYRYDKKTKDNAGNRIRLTSPAEFESSEEASAALYEAIRVLRQTGKTPTDLIGEQGDAAPIDLKEVMSEKLNWFQIHAPDQYPIMRDWCQKAGPLIVDAGTPASPTFGQLAVNWILNDVYFSCKPSTQSDYRSILINHVLPVFGPLEATTITRLEIKGFLQRKAGEGLAKSTVVHLRNTLSGVLNRAVESELLAYNPAHGIKGLKLDRQEREINPFTEEELKALLQAFRAMRPRYFKVSPYPRYYAFVALLALSGLRAGEALGLFWEDIDYRRGVIHVKRSLSKMQLQTPKNHKSRRVEMSGALASILQEHRTQQKKEALARGWGAPADHVIINQSWELVDINHFRTRQWNPALRKAEIPAHRIHDLRHTYATLRLAKGDDLADVSAQLGHHSIWYTLKQYYHWMPGKRSQAELDELSEMLGL